MKGDYRHIVYWRAGGAMIEWKQDKITLAYYVFEVSAKDLSVQLPLLKSQTGAVFVIWKGAVTNLVRSDFW